MEGGWRTTARWAARNTRPRVCARRPGRNFKKVCEMPLRDGPSGREGAKLSFFSRVELRELQSENQGGNFWKHLDSTVVPSRIIEAIEKSVASPPMHIIRAMLDSHPIGISLKSTAYFWEECRYLSGVTGPFTAGLAHDTVRRQPMAGRLLAEMGAGGDTTERDHFQYSPLRILT